MIRTKCRFVSSSWDLIAENILKVISDDSPLCQKSFLPFVFSLHSAILILTHKHIVSAIGCKPSDQKGLTFQRRKHTHNTASCEQILLDVYRLKQVGVSNTAGFYFCSGQVDDHLFCGFRRLCGFFFCKVT